MRRRPLVRRQRRVAHEVRPLDAEAGKRVGVGRLGHGNGAAGLKADDAGRANFATANAQRFILREERTFVDIVDSTFGQQAATLRAS